MVRGSQAIAGSSSQPPPPPPPPVASPPPVPPPVRPPPPGAPPPELPEELVDEPPEPELVEPTPDPELVDEPPDPEVIAELPDPELLAEPPDPLEDPVGEACDLAGLLRCADSRGFLVGSIPKSLTALMLLVQVPQCLLELTGRSQRDQGSPDSSGHGRERSWRIVDGQSIDEDQVDDHECGNGDLRGWMAQAS